MRLFIVLCKPIFSKWLALRVSHNSVISYFFDMAALFYAKLTYIQYIVCVGLVCLKLILKSLWKYKLSSQTWFNLVKYKLWLHCEKSFPNMSRNFFLFLNVNIHKNTTFGAIFKERLLIKFLDIWSSNPRSAKIWTFLFLVFLTVHIYVQYYANFFKIL